MARIRSRARKLRRELEDKEDRRVTVGEVAEGAGVSRKGLTFLELNKTSRAEFEMLVKLCGYYSRVLDRPIDVADILQYDPTGERQAPKARRSLILR